MRVLAAVDLRDDPGPVVANATVWATRLNATLDLLYVDGLQVSLGWGLDARVKALMDKEYERLRGGEYEMLAALMETVPEERRGTVSIVDGSPAETLIERASGYDALLVSTKGRTGLAHFWLGSVAERVVRTSNVPVIVMRPSESVP